MRPLLGIHHITCITGNIEENMRFYTSVLGLRLVKRTINFDDPSAYHLYYGDAQGTPGTLLTFFHWEDIPHGKKGLGQPSAIHFSIPPGSASFWKERLEKEGIDVQEEIVFGKRGISCADPDGILVKFVETKGMHKAVFWKDGGVPEHYAIGGIVGITLFEEQGTDTFDFFHEVMEFPFQEQEKDMHRYFCGKEGQYVDVETTSDHFPGTWGSGSIHHIAYQTHDRASQEEWRSLLDRHHIDVTPLINRLYFSSIYFPEPGGIIFEIATLDPGFLIDEPFESLGENLVFPPWFDQERQERVEGRLPELPSFS